MPPSVHLFVDDIERPVIDEVDQHHLTRVLRLRPGEQLSVSDGRGAVRRCRLAPALALVPEGDPIVVARPEPAVTVAFALVKGDRPEWAVQKLTECGVDRIVPLACERSVVRWEPNRRAQHLERLRRIAREAAMQSRRCWLPVVDDVLRFDEALAALGPVALAHPSGGRLTLDRPALFIGPEGGWSDSELARAPALVDLGPTVLRTETAAVAAGVLLTALRAGIVRLAENPE